MQIIYNYYSRSSVQQAIVEIAKNREVVSVYRNSKFGKRPDVIQYPNDVMQAVAEGAISFHGSVERWSQPMKLDVSMNKPDLDSLRSGWDIFIDPDVPDFEISKIVVKQILEALKDNGVKSFSLKFSGGKGFHIGIPFESFPEKINMQPISMQYPELLQKIIEYLKWYTKDQLREELISFLKPNEISQRINKPLNEIVGKDGLEPFKVVSMDVFGSRHLFRLPYSLHESSLLVSLPIKPESLERFEKDNARPEKVKVEEKFLSQKTRDVETLLIEALDWSAKYKIEVREELPKETRKKRVMVISEELFPPCIKNIFKGLSDGRKRSVFVLINFLRSMGWTVERIEKRLTEWNEKNYPPLRTSYLRSQLRWHIRQSRDLLPPNCDNANFYINYKVCMPDTICKGRTKEMNIKNPVNYAFRKMSVRRKRKIRKR